MAEKKEWFSEWFDSPFYDILYKERNEKEAENFIDNLINYIDPEAGAKILDIPCGKGRHSIYLNKKGYDVTGLDLSERNIKYAAGFSNERLRFNLHDMRKPYSENTFDLVLNLFTSFGYFENDGDNKKTMNTFSLALKKDGIMIIDFMNTSKVLSAFLPEEHKTVDGIAFKIKKRVENAFIVKDIFFKDGDEERHYREKVKALKNEDFLNYFKITGLSLLKTFGDYDLNPFHPSDSDRMIFLLKK